MRFPFRQALPGATSICLRSTLALAVLPAAFGTATALLLVLVAPSTAPLGAAAFALGLVKLAYLGTAAAQIGRGLAERAEGFRLLGWRLDDEPAAVRNGGRDGLAAGYWSRFPNAFDSAVLAAALMTATHLLAR
jgi:hypothetical protein